ncbi:MAG: hypothetical protein RLZZ618_3603 [Pseudomonadota bacterium]|jgi:hypothetical protein
MIKKILPAFIVAGFVAMPLATLPSLAQAKTEKQLRDEHKGKVAKEKSAEKSAAKKAERKNK